MTEFKEAMSKISNTVSLLAFNSGQSNGELRAITISSLISVSVAENEEEVLFVLKKDSSARGELLIGKEISINVLSHLQSNIAQIYGGGYKSRAIDSNDNSAYWDNSLGVPKLKAAHLIFVGNIVDRIGRSFSDVFLCRISTFSISIDSQPLIHYLRRYQSPNSYFL